MAGDREALSEQMDALRKTIDQLPPAEDEAQRQALEALNALMSDLTKLTRTVEAIGTKHDD